MVKDSAEYNLKREKYRRNIVKIYAENSFGKALFIAYLPCTWHRLQLATNSE